MWKSFFFYFRRANKKRTAKKSSILSLTSYFEPATLVNAIFGWKKNSAAYLDVGTQEPNQMDWLVHIPWLVPHVRRLNVRNFT